MAGILEAPWHAYRVDELLARGVVEDEEHRCFLVTADRTVNAFRSQLAGRALSLTLDEDGRLRDASSGGRWDLRGRCVDGPVEENLVPVPLSTEYWFSWKQFHPGTQLVRPGEGRRQTRAS